MTLTASDNITDGQLVYLPPEAGDIDKPRFDPNPDWLATAEPTLQKAAMWRWFSTHYEDPELTTPHDESGAYLFMDGGPFLAAVEQEQGLDAAQFKELYNSFSVASKVRRASRRMLWKATTMLSRGVRSRRKAAMSALGARIRTCRAACVRGRSTILMCCQCQREPLVLAPFRDELLLGRDQLFFSLVQLFLRSRKRVFLVLDNATGTGELEFGLDCAVPCLHVAAQHARVQARIGCHGLPQVRGDRCGIHRGREHCPVGVEIGAKRICAT